MSGHNRRLLTLSQVRLRAAAVKRSKDVSAGTDADLTHVLKHALKDSDAPPHLEPLVAEQLKHVEHRRVRLHVCKLLVCTQISNLQAMKGSLGEHLEHKPWASCYSNHAISKSPPAPLSAGAVGPTCHPVGHQRIHPQQGGLQGDVGGGLPGAAQRPHAPPPHQQDQAARRCAAALSLPRCTDLELHTWRLQTCKLRAHASRKRTMNFA